MPLSVITFGQIMDITGNAFSVDEVPDTDALKAILEKDFPALQQLKYTIAVDKKTITGNTALQPGSVVALLPPFSGG